MRIKSPSYAKYIVVLILLLTNGLLTYCQNVIVWNYGVLVVTVKDESGKTIEGARVRIVNAEEVEVVAMSKANGQIKGELLIESGPYRLHVSADGYIDHDMYGVAVKEESPTEIIVTLRKPGS